MLRIVPDTNIFISSIFWKGNPNKIIVAASEGKTKVLTSMKVIEELRTALGRDFHVPEERINEIISNIVSFSELVETKTIVDLIKDDPSDNKFLEIALEANADYIVSGDKHLLGLKEFRGIKITTAKEMLDVLDM